MPKLSICSQGLFQNGSRYTITSIKVRKTKLFFGNNAHGPKWHRQPLGKRVRKETTYLQTRLCHLCRDRAAGTRAISKEHQELDTVHLQHYLPLERIAVGTSDGIQTFGHEPFGRKPIRHRRFVTVLLVAVILVACIRLVISSH